MLNSGPVLTDLCTTQSPGSPDPGTTYEVGIGMLVHVEVFALWARARFGDDERGASLVEYALLVALIAVVCIGAVTLLGGNAKSKFSTVASSIN